MKTYESYKESGIDWIGEIPKHWIASKLKYYADVITGNTPSMKFDDYYSSSKGVPWVKPNNLNEFKPITTSKQFLTEKGLNEARIVRKGSVLVGGIGDIGKLGVAGTDVTTNQQIHSIEGELNKINDGFLKYLIYNSIDALQMASSSVVLSILTKSKLLDLEVVIPSLKEQTQIANYLDHKTQIIDALIEKKEQLIQKLQAQRQAIINEAVTKGLNPNVKMKDSGVEWLGKIPEHWEICKLKHLAELKSGNFISANNIEPKGKYPVYGGNGLRGYSSDFTHDGSHVLIGRQGALCGNIKYAHDKFWATEHAVVVTFKTSMSLEYFGELLRLMNLNQYNESAAQPGLAVSKIDNLNIPKIPIEEQNEIAHMIRNKISLINSLVDKIKKQLLKLKSYRQSLISEAVTGKIDVRDWQAPDKNQ